MTCFESGCWVCLWLLESFSRNLRESRFSIDKYTLNISLVLTYVFNLIGIGFLTLGAFFLWYRLFDNRRPSASKAMVSLFGISMVYVLLRPIFRLAPLGAGRTIGVSTVFGIDLADFWIILGISAIVGILSYIMAGKFGNYILKLPFATFITYYLYLFVLSVVKFYTAASLLNCRSGVCLYNRVFDFFNSIQIYSPMTVYLADVVQVLSKLLEANFFIISLTFYVLGYKVILNLLLKEKVDIA